MSSDTAPASSDAAAAATARTDQNNDYSLKVKPEFIAPKRPIDVLGELPPEDDPPKRMDDRDDPNNRRNRRRGGKKNKSKKRPRDARQPNHEKVCLAVVKGVGCPYGEGCKFSHDLAEYLKTRPEDIKASDFPEKCPIFEETGYCLFGALCRFGSCHVIKATGENLVQTEGKPQPKPVQNFLPKEVLIQLRKRVYPFKTVQKNGGKTRNHELHNQGKKKGGKDNDKKKEEEKEEETAKKDNEKEEDETKKEETTDVKKEESEEKKDSDDKKEKDDVKKEEDAEMKEASTAEGGEEKKEVSPAEDKKEATPAAEGEEKKDTTIPPKKKPVDPFKPISDPFRPSMKPESNSNTPMPAKTKKIIDFSNKVYVAPLTTVGNLPFRRIMKRFGADITCGEMALAGHLLEGKPSEWALIKRHPDEDVFGVQVASGYPDQFTRVAEVINKHCEVDFLDMNLGCPLDIVCSKGAGASLMLRHNRLKGILEGLTSTLSCPVTIKMRTGWDTDKPFASQLVKRIQGWGMDGVGGVMVHGRSRLQRYSNLADWDYISSVATSQDDSLPKLQVVGNGDILSYTDYEERMEMAEGSGISTCAMLGRGALIKPWLPTEIKEKRHWDISATERLDIMKDFVKFGLAHWGSDDQGVNHTRRFLLEWQSFLCRYVPVGILEGGVPQKINMRPPPIMVGRSDLETKMLSPHSHDWIKLSEMLLGPVPEGFRFEPKHKARSHRD